MTHEDYEFYAELDKVANKTKLTDAMKASQIMDWGKKRGLRIVDEVAVAYALGRIEGKRSNQDRVAKAFAKIYPGKREAAPELVNAVKAVCNDENDVTTPDGNAEVE